MGLTATEGGGTTGIDAELEAKNKIADAFGIEAIPVELDHGDDLSLGGWENRVTDDKVF